MPLPSESHGLPAGILPRVGAWMADFVLLALLVQALQWTLSTALGGLDGLETGPQWAAYLGLTVTLPAGLYLALCEWSRAQATLGKRIFNLRVIDVYGARIGLVRSLVRTAVKLLPWEVTHWTLTMPTPLFLEGPDADLRPGFLVVYVLLGGYLAAAMMTRRKQSVHDLAAGTCVVQRFGAAPASGGTPGGA